MGYERFDAAGFDGSFIVEVAPKLLAGLQRIHASLPPARSTARAPILTMSIAVDVDALIGWLATTSAEIAGPHTCPQLDDAMGALRDMHAELAKPLPAWLHGLRGASLVIDDLSGPPYDGTGYALVAGDRVADLAAIASPMLGGLQLPAGHAIPLPVQQLGLDNVKSAHVALGRDRAVVAVGADSGTRVMTELAAAPANTPLFYLRSNIAHLIQRFPSLKESLEASKLTTMTDEAFTVDVRDDGIVFEVQATWR
jgi:hypothetical protein